MEFCFFCFFFIVSKDFIEHYDYLYYCIQFDALLTIPYITYNTILTLLTIRYLHYLQYGTKERTLLTIHTTILLQCGNLQNSYMIPFAITHNGVDWRPILKVRWQVIGYANEQHWIHSLPYMPHSAFFPISHYQQVRPVVFVSGNLYFSLRSEQCTSISLNLGEGLLSEVYSIQLLQLCHWQSQAKIGGGGLCARQAPQSHHITKILDTNMVTNNRSDLFPLGHLSIGSMMRI